MVQQIVEDKNKQSSFKIISWIQNKDPNVRMILLSSIVGIVGGLAAVLFRFLISSVYWLLHTSPKGVFPDWLILIAAPTIGGLFVGYLVNKYSSESKGHGVPQIIESVNLKNGKMRFRVPLLKMITASITIGSGGSAGREGPIAQIGGGFGSILGQTLKLKNEEVKDLVICGVSSGIAATFNAPLGGILFGLEVIRRDDRHPNIVPLITASVLGTTVGQFFFEDHPSFIFPTNLSVNNVSNLPFFIIMGLIIGATAVLWIKGFHLIENFFEHVKINPIILTGIGGFLVGCMQLYFPQIAGHEEGSTLAINLAFANQIALHVALILFLLKFLATGITLGSGGSGGIFAPTLFLGVMLGVFFGHLFSLIGIFNFNIALYAILGMAGFFAGSMRAPLTAVVMTAEMVKDFKILFPLLVVVLTSWMLSKALLDHDIYLYKLHARGVRFQKQFDILDETLVSSVMIPFRKIIYLSPKDRIEEAIHLIRIHRYSGFPILEGDKIVGIITEKDIRQALENDDIRDWDISKVCTKRIVACLPKTPLSVLMKKLETENINRIPVINSHKDNRLVGWITRSDITKFYLRAKQIQIQVQIEKELFEEISLDEKFKTDQK
jgi:chloride channel protein, CIC family